MLSEYPQNGDYAKAAIARGECYSVEESFEQQKTISQLIERLAKSKVL
jgi:hypothetical protein